MTSAPQAPATPPETVAPARRHLLRRLYDWVLGWADSPYGEPALILLALAESSFFPVPPDVLLMALAVGRPTRALRYALGCSVGSVLGGLLGYCIGAFFWEQAGGFFFAHVPGFTPEAFAHVQELYRQYGVTIVFAAAFTPIPYKVFTIASGVFGLNLPLFMLASLVGRSARFFLVAGLIWRFGPRIREVIDKYFDLCALLFMALLIGGFYAVKFLGH